MSKPTSPVTLEAAPSVPQGLNPKTAPPVHQSSLTRIGIARVEPGWVINGWARRRRGNQDSIDGRILRIQYPISYLNLWLMPKLTVHDFIETKESPSGPECTLGISDSSWIGLVSILPVPHQKTPKFQCVEIRIKIGIHPGKNYTAYRADFFTLETLSVSSLKEMSISLDFTNLSELGVSPHIALWTTEEKDEWKELIVEISKAEVERVARNMIGGTWLYESWETIIEPDEFGQYAEKYTVKK